MSNTQYHKRAHRYSFTYVVKDKPTSGNYLTLPTRALDLSHNHTGRIIYAPFHLTISQRPIPFHSTNLHCPAFIRKDLRISNFQHKILFSEQSRFTNNEFFNKNNLRFWEGFNVLLGIFGTRLKEPIFYGLMTGERDHNKIRI